MVIYESMAIELDRLDLDQPLLEADSNQFEINGKRGSVELAFHLVDGGKTIGHGRKHMLVSGLREYDAAVMDAAIKTYNDGKQAFAAS